ncbi:MAG: KleE stable inheritance protein [Methylococcaceae bacterium]
MAKIINFPKHGRATAAVESCLVLPLPKAKIPRKKLGIGSTFIKVIWVLVVLLLPLVEWIIALDCVFQFFRMLYYWNTKGVHAGITFSLHFFSYAALICFVALYKPKDF